jgi:monoamine oxidase
MNRLTRRLFLAASAAAATAPAFGAAAATGDVDVAIIGAGAAGIAAARRLVGARKSVVLLEAAGRVGGRCVTDTQSFGVPFDRGAHWIHMPAINPVAKLAGRAGVDLYPAPPGQKIRIGRRNARESEMEDFLAGLVRANRAIKDAARGKTDVNCAQALPKDLGEWRPTIEFVLGPFGCAKDLGEISAIDFARSAERDVDAFCRQGFGALIARLADGLPLQLEYPVTRIDAGGRARIDIETPKARFAARMVIVTASTAVLAAGKIKFNPDLPKRQLDALASLRLGTYDHIALDMADNPLGFQRDDLIFEKAQDKRTGAILGNISGTSLTMVDVAGSFARDLSAQGEAAMVAFATDWLSGLYGTDVKKLVKRGQATQWNKEPWALGAFSAASPGGQGARKVLMEPWRDRVFFAGEAMHETLWGTVGGAWESGERAAGEVLKRLGR